MTSIYNWGDARKALLVEYFQYSEGKLYWKKKPARRVVLGARAGTAHNKGYWTVVLKGVVYGEHRIVWFLHTGQVPGELDHINGIRDDNRIENLRSCSSAQNSWNQLPKSNKEVPYKGVYRQGSSWRYSLTRAGVRVTGTGFTTPEDAARAYDVAAVARFGEFARTNTMLGLLNPQHDAGA